MANNTCAQPPELYRGDGSTTKYSFSFPYITTDDIAVFLWDETTDKYVRCTEVADQAACSTSKTEYYFTSSTPVELFFCVAPGLPPTDQSTNFANLIIMRETDICGMSAVFAAGSPIRASDLNGNFTQVLLALQDVDSKIYKAIQEIDVQPLVYKGTCDVTSAVIPSPVANGDIYTNSGTGGASPQWLAALNKPGPITMAPGDLVIYEGPYWNIIPIGSGGTPGYPNVADGQGATLDTRYLMLNSGPNASQTVEGKVITSSTVAQDPAQTLTTKDYVDTVSVSDVTSVNSKQGDVVLDANDVGAATTAQGVKADNAVQPGDNVSVLTNDAGYITDAGVVKLTAGTGITLNPSSGIGTVEITSTGGGSADTLQAVTDAGNTTTNSIQTASITANGSGTFADNVVSGSKDAFDARPDSDGLGGSRITPFSVQVSRASSGIVFSGRDVSAIPEGTNDFTSYIEGDGSGTFASGSIKLNANGAIDCKKLINIDADGRGTANCISVFEDNDELFNVTGEGSAKFKGIISISGQNINQATSTLVLSQESADVSQIRAYGSSDSAVGSLQFKVSAGDGVPDYTPLTLNSNGSATFAGQALFNADITSGVGTGAENTSGTSMSPFGYLTVNHNNRQNQGCITVVDTAAQKVVHQVDGSGKATFAGHMRSGAIPSTGTYVQGDNTGGFTVVSSNVTKAKIKMDGGAEFATSQFIIGSDAAVSGYYSNGSALNAFQLFNGSTSVTKLKSDGSAVFTGDVTAPNVTFNLDPDNEDNYTTTTEEYTETETYEIEVPVIQTGVGTADLVDGDERETRTVTREREVTKTREVKEYVGPVMDVKETLLKITGVLENLKTAAASASTCEELKAAINTTLADI